MRGLPLVALHLIALLYLYNMTQASSATSRSTTIITLRDSCLWKRIMWLRKGEATRKKTFTDYGMETYFHNPRMDACNKTLYTIIVIFLMAIITATGFRMFFWPIDLGQRVDSQIGRLITSCFIFFYPLPKITHKNTQSIITKPP